MNTEEHTEHDLAPIHICMFPMIGVTSKFGLLRCQGSLHDMMICTRSFACTHFGNKEYNSFMSPETRR
jgi:hypothetical protein